MTIIKKKDEEPQHYLLEEGMMALGKISTLHQHIAAVKKGERTFENAFQSVTRMILEKDIDKVMVNGKNTFDFKIFREGKKTYRRYV
jgi:hypothetical protein